MSTSETARRPSALGAFGAHWDIVLGICAILFALPSIPLPFAHDQGLYSYVAREWVQHGSIPYRDVYDHKTPGIYILHAITILLFGCNSWGIRIADIGCIMALGLVSARLATPKGSSSTPGFRGLCCLIASVLHYGFFNYWDTAQSEIWYATFGLASVCAAWHAKEDRRAQVTSGLLAGVAVIIKPPAIWFAFVALGILLIRARKNVGGRGVAPALRAIVIFGVSAAVPVSLVLAYFGAHRALPAMYDIVVGANSYYIVHESNIDSVGDIFVRTGQFLQFNLPFSPLVLFAVPVLLAVALKKRLPDLRSRYALVGALLVASLGSVIMQQKFYLIHWIVVLGPLSALFANLAWDAIALLSKLVGSRLKSPTTVATFLVAAALGVGFALTTSATALWAWEVRIEYELYTGKRSRFEFAREFQNVVMYYYEADLEAVSAYIVENSKPTDTICVRGFNPEVYILTNRRYEGRFFWSNFLTDPRRAYRREAYLAEDRAAFQQSQPRYVVALRIAHDTLDAAEWYLPLGYEVRKEFGTLILLERRSDVRASRD